MISKHSNLMLNHLECHVPVLTAYHCTGSWIAQI